MGGGGKGDRLESGQMPTRADLRDIVHRRVRPSGYGLRGSHRSREVPAQMKRNGSMDRAQSSGAEGAAIMGLYPSSFLSFFVSLSLSFMC